MKRRLGIALALALLGAAGAALAAAGMTITLGASGLDPATTTVQWGQTVTFTNADSEAHAIAIPRAAFTSELIPPGGTLDYVFDGQRGGYSVHQLGARQFNGRIVVELTGEVTLTEPPASVPYRKRLVLHGTSSIVGHPVAIGELRPGEQQWRDIATADPAPDGTFRTRLVPTPGAHYRATAAGGQLRSRPVRVGIRPTIALRASPRSASVGTRIVLTARVRPGEAAARAQLEAYDRRRKHWLRVASARIGRAGSAVFRWRAVAGRTLLRATVPRTALADGYVPTTSRRVTVRGR